MSIDELLRETLRSYAGRAPGSAGLVAAARGRAVRRRRHHLATAGVAVIAAVAVVLTGWAWRPGEPEVSPATGPVALPTRGPVTLVPARYELPAVPLTPGWVPEGAGEPYAGFTHRRVAAALFGGSGTPGFWLAHDHDRGGSDDRDAGYRVISFDVSPIDIGGLFVARFDRVTTEEVTVQGRPATLWTAVEPATGQTAVAWQHHADLWVTVYGDAVGREEVLRYAEDLRDEPFPVTVPFTFALMPAGAEPLEIHRSGFTFGWPAGDPADPTAVSVHLFHAGRSEAWRQVFGFGTHDHREWLRVGGHDAELIEGPGIRAVRVLLDEDYTLHVSASGSTPPISRDDLVRFAAGVGLTPRAVANLR
jgi:hypothetical protein